jgi:hypothetical protein
MPTVKQMLACVRVCQTLSNFYLDIHLFRYDLKQEKFYILAGASLGVTIFSNGNWEFDEDESI